MGELMLELAGLAGGSPAQVGAKAWALGQLAAAGFPVPPGLVILPDAFEDGALRAEAAAMVGRRLATWRTDAPNMTFAVRSSSPEEDSPTAAFAGQFLTHLNVAAADVVAAAEAVYASRDRAAAYRWARGLGGPVPQGLAVLVQPLVQAACAGVALSVDPVGPEHACVVVNAAWGLGPGVVEGTVPVDTYWVRRHDLRLARQDLATKTSKIVPDARGGVCEAAVPPDQQAVPCLPAEWAARVGQVALAAEQHRGAPQDVEWAIAEGQVWVLQSRPITALPAQARPAPFPITWDDEDDRRHYWSLWPLAPHGVLWPLEQDQIAWMSRSETEKRRRGGADFLGRAWVSNGRAYRGILPNPEPPAQRQHRRAALAAQDAALHATGSNLWEHYKPAIVAATERLRAFRAVAATSEGLAAHLQDALAVYHEHSVLHGLVWSDSSAFSESYARVTGQVPTEAAVLALFVGEETALSRLADGVYELATLARAAPAVAELMANPSPETVSSLRALPEATHGFLAALDRFLEVYGDRTGVGAGSEGTLALPTLREQPEGALQWVAAYLDGRLPAPAEVRLKQRAARDAQIEALCAACPEAEAVAAFRREWTWALRESVVLEDHNYYLDQLAPGQLRTAVLHAARRLAALGQLDQAEDVFWLTFDEILAALRTGEPASFARLIADRQARHATWERLPPPPFLGLPPQDLAMPTRFGEPPAPVSPPDRPPLGPNQLQGQGASAGQVTGRARLLQPHEIAPRLETGDILVARTAGPLWTPFFPMLGGLVLERAAIGQHAAATAREYGLPAVINCRDAMQHIQEGDIIHLDGTTGVITLLSEEL